MAYTKKVEGRSYPYLYNVELSVGQRKSVVKDENSTTIYGYYQPNRSDDVMLVQYLLKRVYQRAQAANLNGGSSHPDQLKVDGIWGPRTQAAIEQYQLEMARNGRSIATDGVVDSEKGSSTTASISQTGYTISWLNKYFWVLWPTLAPNVMMDGECPQELKLALSRGKIQ
jgi:hypothetical protein